MNLWREPKVPRPLRVRLARLALKLCGAKKAFIWFDDERGGWVVSCVLR